ncbi:hypothetical protein ACMFMF_004173 [Clarireedia jacksonii]
MTETIAVVRNKNLKTRQAIERRKSAETYKTGINSDPFLTSSPHGCTYCDIEHDRNNACWWSLHWHSRFSQPQLSQKLGGRARGPRKFNDIAKISTPRAPVTFPLQSHNPAHTTI